MAGSGGDHLGDGTVWFVDENRHKDSIRSSRQLEENAAEQKIIALQRELKEQSTVSATLRKCVRDLEIDLAQAQDKLLYHKAPSNAELWQQLTTHRELVKELEDRCERLNKEAKRAQQKRYGQECVVNDLTHRYINSCANSATNIAATSSISVSRHLPEQVEQVSAVCDDIEKLETLLASREADIKEFREELLEGAELLEKANEENDELKEKIQQLEDEIRTLAADNSKAVAVNLKLHKRIDRLDGRLQELLKELEGEKERNSFLAGKLESAEIERRSDVSRLKSQLHQAVRGLESLSDKQRSGTSIRSGLSHLLAKLRPTSKPTRSQSFATPVLTRVDRQPEEYSCRQKR